MSGANPCFTSKCLVDILGLEEAVVEEVEFDSIVNCTAQAKLEEQWMETLMEMKLDEIGGTGFIYFVWLQKNSKWSKNMNMDTSVSSNESVNGTETMKNEH